MILKTCPCCSADYTLAAWLALPLVGTQPGEPGEVLELRNCACTNTMSIAHRAQGATHDEHRAYGAKFSGVYGRLAVLPQQTDERAQEALDAARELLQSYAVRAYQRCGETPLTPELAASVAREEARRAAE